MQFKFENKAHVYQEVAHYFKRRKVLPNQQIEEELQEGGLIVSELSANGFHLLAIVRYWIPFVSIMSPLSSILKSNQILKNYLEQ